MFHANYFKLALVIQTLPPSFSFDDFSLLTHLYDMAMVVALTCLAQTILMFLVTTLLKVQCNSLHSFVLMKEGWNGNVLPSVAQLH